MENRFYFKTFDKGFVYIEDNKGKLKLRYNNVVYSSGINFIRDIVGVELNEEPDYDIIVRYIKKL